VFDHKEAIKHTDSQSENGKEVKRCGHFATVIEEGQPALCFSPTVVPLKPMQIPGYGRLRNLEPQL
jgi:hypothetical protein